jgi:diguanylate cyclase
VRADEEGHHWTLHNDQVTDKADLGQILLADVDGALDRGDIFVVFQPKWQFAQERIAGAEALVRWRHATLGPIGPDQFIPVLEQSGRLEQLTLHVFDRSIEQMRRWADAGLDMDVAINISAPLFADVAFVSILKARITNCGTLASQITLEITESATIASPEQTVKALESIRALGAKISIDDYGTGQSTLSYLKTFPADEIKIDQSFVTRMLASNNDQILVRSTIELAHQLGFKVVAEGIEERDCFDRLAEYGCDTGQGWHIGKPIPADAFYDLVTVPKPLTAKA